MNTVGILTTSRADYGLMRNLIEILAKSALCNLKVFVSGSHVISDFGFTSSELKEERVVVTKSIEFSWSGDSKLEIAKTTASFFRDFSIALAEERLDVLVVLGDRYEVFIAGYAAALANIPIVHIHGGEVTYGSVDDKYRHALTKLADYHFVSCDDYRLRVIQLGEHPSRVFNVGAIGMDNLSSAESFSKEELEHDLGFKFRDVNILVAFHPATALGEDAMAELIELLAALRECDRYGLICTGSNIDFMGEKFSRRLENFCSVSENALFVESLGYRRFLSVAKNVTVVVGNSSSAILELSGLPKVCVNVGIRQAGRVLPSTIVNTEAKRNAILSAISTAISLATEQCGVDYREINPYGNGGSSVKIAQFLEKQKFGVYPKIFYDLPKNLME